MKDGSSFAPDEWMSMMEEDFYTDIFEVVRERNTYWRQVQHYREFGDAGRVATPVMDHWSSLDDAALRQAIDQNLVESGYARQNLIDLLDGDTTLPPEFFPVGTP
jgi:hypothetical protein